MISVLSITKNADNSWLFTWAGTGSWRVVLQGQQLATVTSPSYTWSGTGFSTSPPPLEIVPIGTLALSEQYKPYLIMQWYGSNVDTYLIQQIVNGHWQNLTTIQETGQWLYTFQTVTLADETIYSYRVIARDKIGNQSVPRGYKALIVCPPQPPAVKIDYTNPNLVVSAP